MFYQIIIVSMYPLYNQDLDEWGKMWIEVNHKYISFWVPMSVILSANYNDTLVVDHLF